MKSIFFNDQPIYLVTDLKYKSENNFYNIETFDVLLHIKKIGQGLSGKTYLYHKDFNKLWQCFSKQFKSIEAAGGKVYNDCDEVLFIYRNGKWDLPKGKIEKGESIKEAAVREVEEETAIENLRIIEQLETTYHIYEHKERYVLKISYWFKMISDFKGELLPQQEEGITKVEWLSNTEIEKALRNTYENIKLLF